MNKSITNEKIISALLTSNTRLEACEKLKIKPDTLYSRMKDPTFAEMYRDAKDNLLRDVVESLRIKMLEAVDMMYLVMTGATNDQTRLNASESILRYGTKFIEQMDIIERLEELEKAQKELNGNE